MSTQLHFLSQDAELQGKFEALAPQLSRMNFGAKVLEYDFQSAMRMLEEKVPKDQDQHRAYVLHIPSDELEEAYSVDFSALRGDVIVVSSLDSAHVSRKILSAGAIDYVATNDFEEDLLDGVAKLSHRSMLDNKVVGLTGVGGGAGASTLAQLLAYHVMKARDCEVALVDFDLTLGRQSVDLGLAFKGSYSQGYAEDPTGNSTVDGLFQASVDGLHVFGGPHTINLGEIEDFESATSFLQTLRAAYPVSILDIPTRMTGFDIDLLKAIDHLVVVATPDLVGLRNLRNLKSWIAESDSVAYSLVVNKQPAKPNFSETELKTLLGDSLKSVVPVFAKALEHQDRVDLAKAPHIAVPKPVTASLQALASALDLDSVPESGKKKAFKFW